MSSDNNARNFGLLRTILRALGLSPDAVQDIIERIEDWLGTKTEPDGDQAFPYRLRSEFLSPAERSFYFVLSNVVAQRALVLPKIALGEVFNTISHDPSGFQTYRNKIDRKHVDFLLCNPRTVQPLLGIELDDKSHQRADRQTRDAFVEQVFAAAKLPLVRVPVRATYATLELEMVLRPYLETPASSAQANTEQPVSPRCPKCGSEMVLRKAKQSPNQGQPFWGCTNYPRCRGIVQYQAPKIAADAPASQPM